LNRDIVLADAQNERVRRAVDAALDKALSQIHHKIDSAIRQVVELLLGVTSDSWGKCGFGSETPLFTLIKGRVEKRVDAILDKVIEKTMDKIENDKDYITRTASTLTRNLESDIYDKLREKTRNLAVRVSNDVDKILNGDVIANVVFEHTDIADPDLGSTNVGRAIMHAIADAIKNGVKPPTPRTITTSRKSTSICDKDAKVTLTAFEYE